MMNEPGDITEAADAAEVGVGSAVNWNAAVWRVLHGGIICFFLLEIFYVAHQVFVVLQPPEAFLWLGSHTDTLSWETLVIRRLYAMEGWVAMAGLAVYLAITEVRPRLWSRDARHR